MCLVAKMVKPACVLASTVLATAAILLHAIMKKQQRSIPPLSLLRTLVWVNQCSFESQITLLSHKSYVLPHITLFVLGAQLFQVGQVCYTYFRFSSFSFLYSCFHHCWNDHSGTYISNKILCHEEKETVTSQDKQIIYRAMELSRSPSFQTRGLEWKGIQST